MVAFPAVSAATVGSVAADAAIAVVFITDDSDWFRVVTSADVSGDAVAAAAIVVQTPAPVASEVVSASLPSEAGALLDYGTTTD